MNLLVYKESIITIFFGPYCSTLIRRMWWRQCGPLQVMVVARSVLKRCTDALWKLKSNNCHHYFFWLIVTLSRYSGVHNWWLQYVGDSRGKVWWRGCRSESILYKVKSRREVKRWSQRCYAFSMWQRTARAPPWFRCASNLIN